MTRTYLDAGGVSRYAVMRRFRRRITEFALDPGNEPEGFASHRWRYPVRLETALEYLCLSAREHAMLYTRTPGEEPVGDVPAAWQLYGFSQPVVSDRSWTRIAVRLPEFLRRTGLDYCDLVELQRSGIVRFDVTPAAHGRREGDGRLPDCPPCDPQEHRLRFPAEGESDDTAGGLVRLALVARLQARLRGRCAGGLSFQNLADLDAVLHLFAADGTVNPDFLRQLAAVLMLCDDFGLPLGAGGGSGPLERMPLLALWAEDASEQERSRAVGLLLDGVEESAGRADPDLETTPELIKIIGENLDALSRLSGFDPAVPSDSWRARPAATLRFAEVLLKVYLSPFTVGELLFLLTADDHLEGDDPFPLQDRNEAAEDPLALGDTEAFDGQGPHSLWTLRAALREAAVSQEDVERWSWHRIVRALRADFGHLSPATGPDPLDLLGRRFFAGELRAAGTSVSPADSRFSVPLPAAETSPDMWAGGPPEGGFAYDAATEELYCRLPLRDADVLDRLLHVRPLNAAERRAVRDLYFAPRVALAPFAAIFENPVEAIESLVREGDSHARLARFRTAFALFRRRCELIARHLAGHVLAAAGDDPRDAERAVPAAWLLLRELWADENLGLEPWEADSGAPPRVTWPWRPGGGAFAALLGLTGTGLTGEYTPADSAGPLLWREVRGPMSAFGDTRNANNAPVPTVVPAMDLELTPRQLRYLSVRNGLALLDDDGEPLGGAQAFTVRWHGVLLVEEGGVYRFHAGCLCRTGRATEHEDHGHDQGHRRGHGHGWRHDGDHGDPHGDGGEDGPDDRYRHGRADGHDDRHGEGCDRRDWRVVLRRGQRVWTVLNHGMPGDEAPGHRSGPLRLRRGAYAIVIEARQHVPELSHGGDADPVRTGFRFAYSGPDTSGEVTPLPFDRLFRPAKTASLSDGVVRQPTDGESAGGESAGGESAGGERAGGERAGGERAGGERAGGEPTTVIRPGEAAAAWLDGLYTSSLRDIRRTYQRAFKALLLAHRFGLSARPERGYRQSELGHLLAHGETFAGTAHLRTGPASFGVHRAWMDPDLLPVADPYLPDAVADQRGDPSPQRRAALFDVWERLYDYRDLRRRTGAARERPAWLLFAEVAERQPDDPAHLLRHLGVDARHAPLVTAYFDVPPDPYRLAAHDLADERWAIRAWRGSRLLRDLTERLVPPSVGAARPDLWAADDPGEPVGTPPLRGTANLIRFVEDAYVENTTPRRYTDLRRLNDGLRERARRALLAYLCGMDRVALPTAPGRFVRTPGELSDLLLQDVEAGPGQRTTRIEDGVAAVQAFVQRALLGLEPALAVGPGTRELWRSRFATFADWRACARRQAYRENWIEWKDLREARRSEAFRLLDAQLREDRLSVPVPGGLEWWPGPRPAGHPALGLLQDGERAVQRLLDAPAEGLGLLGRPLSSAQPAWLTPAPLPLDPGGNGEDDETDGGGSREDDRGGDGGSGEGRGGRRRSKTGGRSRRRALPAAAEPTLTVSASVEQPAETRLPLWLTAAISLGVPFVRVAAAGVPYASAHPHPSGPASGCCDACDHDDPEEVVDEYYFWLVPGARYDADDPGQDADAGVVISTAADPADQTSDWHRPDKLPGLLNWLPGGTAHLWWCRVRGGRFEPPRRSAEGVRLRPGSAPVELVFQGRTGDSLRFTVPSAVRPVGHSDPTSPGFRYDMAPDAALTLPLVAPATPSGVSYPGGMAAYPYFAFEPPGAPLLPLSPFPVVSAVAGALRTHCRFDAALAWYDLAHRPLDADNAWRPGGPPEPLSPVAVRRRAMLLSYAETLAQAADAYLNRGDAESTRLARVLLDVLARLLGEAPRRITGPDEPEAAALSAFSPRPASLNPRLLALYDRCADRLGRVRHDLDGHRPHPGGRAAEEHGEASCESGCDGAGCHGATGPYRFAYLLQKALDITGEVRGFGASLLTLYEKGDAEGLAALRAAHEHQLVELGRRTRQLQWREADWQLQALEKTKQGALARLAYYQRLLQGGNNAGEIGYETLTVVSTASRVAGNISEGIAQGIGMSPDFWLGVAGIMGTPLQFNQFPLGNKLAAGFSTAARIMNSVAENAGTSGALSLTEGGWQRREDEWRHQIQVIAIELQQIERQILAAERHRDVALRDLDVQEEQVGHTAEVQDYLRDRFTSAELYLHLQRETAALYRQLYDLALRTARRARRAFLYERGPGSAAPALPEAGWDSLRQGLVAGERLHLALRQTEAAYLEENCREYELTRHLSLRLDFPMAFLQLQQTGYCEIEVPEWLFDLDHPGHYMRRIRNVTVTIPCVVGPYVGVNCRLTLLSSQTRVDPALRDAAADCCGACPREPGCRCADAGRCLCPGGGSARRCRCARGGCSRCPALPDPAAGYALAADDPRVARAHDATEAIATSGGQNDSGLFELSFRDERYLPFEFRGAVSRWRFELPPEDNRFELGSVSDVLLHLNYTAREGGDRLREAARAHARGRLPGEGFRIVDVSRDLPDDWYRLRSLAHRPWVRWPLRLGRELFPFVPGGCDLRVTRLELFIEVGTPGCRSSVPVRLLAGHRGRHGEEHRGEHGQDEPCGCPAVEAECVASADWPCLFHGVLEAELPVDGSQQVELVFPELPGGISALYLLCGYGHAAT
ncbi:neuraminidase-like domain-containing protein [Streptosporangium carneum]|uniref:Tc toxin subunit A-related protein n=1 Tax=Streptosporangium carneum TaxID=47481 RepID=UPI0031F16987